MGYCSLEIVVEPWIETLLVALCKHFQLPVPSANELSFTPKPLRTDNNKDINTQTQEQLTDAASKLSIEQELSGSNKDSRLVDSSREWISKIPATDEAQLTLPVPPAQYLLLETATESAVSTTRT